MAIDFPNNPSLNDQFSANGTTYKWNGVSWVTVRITPVNKAGDTMSGNLTAPMFIGDLQGATATLTTGVTIAGNPAFHAGNVGTNGSTVIGYTPANLAGDTFTGNVHIVRPAGTDAELRLRGNNATASSGLVIGQNGLNQGYISNKNSSDIIVSIYLSEMFRVKASGRILVGTTTDDGVNLLQVAGGIAGTRLESTVATGTAPLSVASTTLVSNLNAELLNGQNAAYYADIPARLGYTPANKAGDTFTGRVILAASTASVASINIPHGTAPTTPDNGDIWTTATNMHVQINGATKTLVHLQNNTIYTAGAKQTFTHSASSAGLRVQAVATADPSTPADGDIWASSSTNAIYAYIGAAKKTFAFLESPDLTGTPTAPTATAGTNTTQIATTAFVQAATSALVTGVSSFNTRQGAITLTSADVTTALTFTPANKAGDTFTGAVQINTGSGAPFIVNAAGDGYAGGVLAHLRTDSTATSNVYLRLTADTNGTPVNFGDFSYDATGLRIASPRVAISSNATIGGTLAVTSTATIGDGSSSTYALSINTYSGATPRGLLVHRQGTPTQGLHIHAHDGSRVQIDAIGSAKDFYINQTMAAPMRFVSQNVEVFQVSTGQRLLIGTTTDNNTDKLQVSGSTFLGGNLVLGTQATNVELQIFVSTTSARLGKIKGNTGATLTSEPSGVDVMLGNDHVTPGFWVNTRTAAASSASFIFNRAVTAATGDLIRIAEYGTTRFSISSSGDATFANNVTVTGNLTVNGTTTTVNSTTVTIDDPVFTLGGDTPPSVDDNKDRGIEFRWHNGTNAKLGFFGFDDSIGKFTFIPDAINTAEVFSGSVGTIVAHLEGNQSGGSVAATTISASGAVTLSGGDILLANATANFLRFFNAGVGDPTFTTRSNGTKIVLYPELSATAADFALGISAGVMWSSVPNTTHNFRWYGGTALAATISGTGNITAVGTVQGTQLISTVATGTAPLTVASTTKVVNLNAELLDGYDSADFPRKAENAAITGNWTFDNGNTTGADSATPSVDIRGAFLRIGDSGATRTFTSPIGIKFHDVGVSHGSLIYDPADSAFYFDDSSSVSGLVSSSWTTGKFKFDLSGSGTMLIGSNTVYHQGNVGTNGATLIGYTPVNKAGDTITGNVVLASTATPADNSSVSSPTLTLRNFYDSDDTAAVASLAYNLTFTHAMTAVGASPASKLDLAFGGTTRFTLNSAGTLTIPHAGTDSVERITFGAGSMVASGYHMFFRGYNDVGGAKVVHFLNGSARATEGGANCYTIRNDGGPLRLGITTQNTSIEGLAITLTGNMTVNGSIQHNGLNPSAGTNIDQIYSVTDSLTLTTAWQDTSVNGSELETGTYIVHVRVSDSAVGGGHGFEYYSGIMSWYGGDPDSATADEIILHRAGSGPGSGAIFLRVQRTLTADASDLKLQIAGLTNNSGASNYLFKFRRMI